MSSDTSLIFNMVPRGAGAVQADIARTAATIVAANDATRRSNDDTVRSHQRASREVFKIDNTFRNTFRRMASIAGLWGALIIAVIGHTVAFIQAIWSMLGVLAIVPAVAFAAVAGLAPLIAVFSGIGAAMKKTGGGAGNSAQQIAQAERRIEQAQRGARDAQEALNRAREDAADRLRDINLAFARANLDQKEAALAVKDAQEALRRARQSGDAQERRRAELALQSALLSQQEVAARLSDVTQEYQERNAKGVEGSDEVRDATERQTDALYELAEAQRALTQAQKGGGGADAALEAYRKLSPAGRELVDVLKSIAPAWRTMKNEIQQTALAGVAGRVSSLSALVLQLRPQILGIAAAWNTAFKGILSTFQAPDVVVALNVALRNTVTFSQNLARSWAPFLHGFMMFVYAGSDSLPRFGSWIEKLANQFDHWATTAAQSGKIADWIDKGAKAAADFGHWIRDISGGIGAIFRAGSGGPNYLAQLADDAARWRETMNDPEFQARLAAFFESARNAGSALWVVIKALTDAITSMPGVIKELAGALNIVGVVLGFAADHAALLNAILPPLISIFIVYKTVTMAVRLATMAWTTAQLILNGALWANPIGLVILAITALIVIIILVIKYHKEIGHFFTWAWGKLLDGVMFVWNWVKDNWQNILGFLTGPIGSAISWIVDHWTGIKTFVMETIPGWFQTAGEKIGGFFSSLWGGIVGGAKAALNSMIGLLNTAIGFINTKLIDNANKVPFVNIPHIPNIPKLDTGGSIMSSGLIFAHQGEEVVKAADVRRGGSRGGGTLTFHLNGPAQTRAQLKQLIREITYNDGGGDVQVAFGR